MLAETEGYFICLPTLQQPLLCKFSLGKHEHVSIHLRIRNLWKLRTDESNGYTEVHFGNQ